MQSMGIIILQLFFSEEEYMLLMMSSVPFSNREAPTFNPLNFKKLFAIAPTIIRLFVFFDKFKRTFILVDTFDPPIIDVTGFFLFLMIKFID